MTRYLVDTNILIDITSPHSELSEASLLALDQCDIAIINPIIYTELSAGSLEKTWVDELCEDLDLTYREIPKEALYLTSKTFRQYKRNQGSKNPPLADFIIGAHAAFLGILTLT